MRTPKSDAAPWRRDRWERLLSRRGFTVATIHVARLGKIRVYVTHLGNSPDQQVQPAEVEQLIRFQQADAKKHKPQGTVIFGDFNAELASRALAPLWGAGFRVHSAGTAALRVEHGHTTGRIRQLQGQQWIGFTSTAVTTGARYHLGAIMAQTRRPTAR